MKKANALTIGLSVYFMAFFFRVGSTFQYVQTKLF